MTSFDLLTWATVFGTWVLVVGTLAFSYWQLRQAQRLHSASTLLDLRERYYSPRMRVARREFSSWLLRKDRSDEADNWEVGIFFELMGYLTRTGVLHLRIVSSAFGTWITAYYLFLTQPVNLIEQWRTESNDPLIFAEFEWLARALLRDETRGRGRRALTPTSLEDARYVLEIDSRLASTGPLTSHEP